MTSMASSPTGGEQCFDRTRIVPILGTVVLQAPTRKPKEWDLQNRSASSWAHSCVRLSTHAGPGNNV